MPARAAPCRRCRGDPGRLPGAVMSAPGLAHPPLHQVRAIIGRALDEDIGGGDVTTDNSVPADQRSGATLLAKQVGVLCGVHVFSETLAMVDRGVTVTVERPDGARSEEHTSELQS